MRVTTCVTESTTSDGRRHICRTRGLIPRALAIQADTPDSVDLAFGSMSRATGEFRGKSRRQRGADKDRFFGDIKEAEEALRRKKNK